MYVWVAAVLLLACIVGIAVLGYKMHKGTIKKSLLIVTVCLAAFALALMGYLAITAFFIGSIA